MSNPCENCERLQEMFSSNACKRPTFHQPTMYDHMESFAKYKEAKALDRKLRATKKELSKLNQNFTNLQLDVDEAENLSKFKPQDIALIRCATKDGRLVGGPEAEEPEDLWEKLYESKPKSLLTTISRTPVQCPVSRCGMVIGVTSVLAHFLRDHNKELVVDCKNLYAGGHSIVRFNRKMFEFGENVCLGVLPYGGVESDADSRPAVRGICKQNSFLSSKYAHLENHLPILIMVCKTSICAMLEDKKLAEQLSDVDNTAKHILVMWLVSAQTTKPIYSTITVFDDSMTSARSTIIPVRSLDSTQNPNEFLHKETSYLILDKGELDVLSDNNTTPIMVEIKINEFDE